MKDIALFQFPNGAWITTSHLLSCLEMVKAQDARVLYMHTGLTFGTPNPQISRQELLGHLYYDVVESLGVPTLLVPTFTFSFCNGESYSVQTSRCRMGALNEYIRKLPSAIRSVDPLMSSVLIGEDSDLVCDLGKHSIGANSTFDKLHERGKAVKFLFLGTTVSECFTYTHYVEERLAMPYRYNRDFAGSITDKNRTWEDTYTLYIRYKGVVPTSSGLLENTLLRRRLLQKVDCGASSISCLSEPDGYETIVEHLRENISAYVDADPGDRNTEFSVSNMVTL
jgi:aminoglycoside 3-N-acetyltransferase